MVPLFIKSLKTHETQSPASHAEAPNIRHFSHLLAALSSHRSGGDFGPHNVDTGHHVAFAAGTFTGAGKVTTTGRDGLTVEDDKRREHRVHWREITGHFVPEKSSNDTPSTGSKKTNA